MDALTFTAGTTVLDYCGSDGNISSLLPLRSCLDLEALMEAIRQDNGVIKSWPEIVKNAKSIVGKRSLDSTDRLELKKCFEALRYGSKTCSKRDLVNKLCAIAQKVGLKFYENAGLVSLSDDVVLIDIKVDDSGTVLDVITVFGKGGPNFENRSESLLQLAKENKWEQFGNSVSGLLSTFSVEGGTTNKINGFKALRTMELQLLELQRLPPLTSNIRSDICGNFNDGIGVLRQRDAARKQKLVDISLKFRIQISSFLSLLGNPAMLWFCITPSEVIQLKHIGTGKLFLNELWHRQDGLGHWCYLTLCKTPRLFRLSVHASFFGDNSDAWNSGELNAHEVELPATLMLKFKKPFPMLKSLANQIESITNQSVLLSDDALNDDNLLSIVIKQRLLKWASCQQLEVILPDQVHKYSIQVADHKHLPGVLCSEIPFTQLSMVEQIITILRRQAIFNSLLISCVRKNPEKDVWQTHSASKFHLTFPSTSSAEILFENPNVVRVRFDFANAQHLECSLNAGAVAAEATHQLDRYCTEVFNKCWSFPVCLRALINKMKQGPLGNQSEDTDMDFSPSGGGTRDASRGRPGDNGRSDTSAINGDGNASTKELSSFSTKDGADSSNNYQWYTCYACPSFTLNTSFALYANSCFSHFKASLAVLPVSAKLSVLSDTTAHSKARPANLLDIFKDVDEEWEELIPPHPRLSKAPPVVSSVASNAPMSMDTVASLAATSQMPKLLQQSPVQQPHPPAQHLQQHHPPPSPQYAVPQSRLSKPTSIEFAATASAQQMMPSPVGPALPAAAAIQKSPKLRHISNASDTLGDLDTLCALSKSITGDPSNDFSGLTTPTSDRMQVPFSASSIASLSANSHSSSASTNAVIAERKSSIQDAIDSVMHSFGGKGSANVAVSHANSSAALLHHQLQLLQHPNASQNSALQSHPTPMHASSTTSAPRAHDNTQTANASSGLNTLSSLHDERERMFAHSRSLDYDILEHTDRSSVSGLDEFDFEKSDPLEAGLIDYGRGRSYSLQDTSPAGTPNFYQNVQDVYSQATCGASDAPTYQTLVRGMANRSQLRRRRSRRSAGGNVSDRMVDASIKELKKVEKEKEGCGSVGSARGTGSNRRPRKGRGAVIAAASHCEQQPLPGHSQFFAPGPNATCEPASYVDQGVGKMLSPPPIQTSTSHFSQFGATMKYSSDYNLQQQTFSSGIAPPPSYSSTMQQQQSRKQSREHGTMSSSLMLTDELMAKDAAGSCASQEETAVSTEAGTASRPRSFQESSDVSGISFASGSSAASVGNASFAVAERQGLEAEDSDEESECTKNSDVETRTKAETEGSRSSASNSSGSVSFSAEKPTSISDLGGNLFENLGRLNSQQLERDSSAGVFAIPVSGFVGVTAQTKPNANPGPISKRKPSLDKVIGKLMENATSAAQVVESCTPTASLSEDAAVRSSLQMDDDNGPFERTGFAAGTVHAEQQQSLHGQVPTLQPIGQCVGNFEGSGNSGIKLVIKKTNIKMPTLSSVERSSSSLAGGGSAGAKSHPPKQSSLAKQTVPPKANVAEALLKRSNSLSQALSAVAVVDAGSFVAPLPKAVPATVNDKLVKLVRDREKSAQVQQANKLLQPNKFDVLKEKLREKKSKKALDPRLSPSVSGQVPPALKPIVEKPSKVLMLKTGSKSLAVSGAEALSKKHLAPVVLPSSDPRKASITPDKAAASKNPVTPEPTMVISKPLKVGFKIPKIEDSTKTSLAVTSGTPSAVMTAASVQIMPTVTFSSSQVQKRSADEMCGSSSDVVASSAKKQMLEKPENLTMPRAAPPVPPRITVVCTPKTSASAAVIKTAVSPSATKSSAPKFAFQIGASDRFPAAIVKNLLPSAGFAVQRPELAQQQALVSSPAVRSAARRTLLPDPHYFFYDQSAPATTNSTLMPQLYASTTPAVLPFMVRHSTSVVEDPSFEEPVCSPEDNMLVIDDSIKSPVPPVAAAADSRVVAASVSAPGGIQLSVGLGAVASAAGDEAAVEGTQAYNGDDSTVNSVSSSAKLDDDLMEEALGFG